MQGIQSAAAKWMAINIAMCSYVGYHMSVSEDYITRLPRIALWTRLYHAFSVALLVYAVGFLLLVSLGHAGQFYSMGWASLVILTEVARESRDRAQGRPSSITAFTRLLASILVVVVLAGVLVIVFGHH